MIDLRRHDDMARPPIDRGESDAVLELCRRKTETEYDCEYFYHYELDGERRLKNLFWADTDSGIDDIMGYGDVVVFGTMFRTNKHGVPFVPFVGLSPHRTPIVLGGAERVQDPDVRQRGLPGGVPGLVVRLYGEAPDGREPARLDAM
jgi:hypothetical protein